MQNYTSISTKNVLKLSNFLNFTMTTLDGTKVWHILNWKQNSSKLLEHVSHVNGQFLKASFPTTMVISDSLFLKMWWIPGSTPVRGCNVAVRGSNPTVAHPMMKGRSLWKPQKKGTRFYFNLYTVCIHQCIIRCSFVILGCFTIQYSNFGF